MSAIDPPPPAMPTVGPNELTGFGVRTIVITLIFTLVATISVFGRFGARFLNGVKPLLEDWLVVVALIFTWGYAAGNIIFSYNGLGVPGASLIAAGRDYQLKNQLKLLIANQVTYAVALGLVKTSLLLSMIRIFHVFKKFRIVAYCAITLCIAWALQTILIAFLICRPISYNWDQVNQTGTCGNLTSAYVSVGIVDVITDIIIFILPLPLISRLNMRRSSKLATMALFTLGVFTVAAGAARTAMIYRVQFDPTDPEGPTMNLIWAAVEPCVAIVVASLLVTKPLFVLMRAKASSLFSSLPYASAWSSKGTSKGDSFRASEGTSRSKKGFVTQKNESECELQSVQNGKIWQTTEVQIDETEAYGIPSAHNPRYKAHALSAV